MIFNIHKHKSGGKEVNIGIDIDGVLTNDDEYTMCSMSKFIYENKLQKMENPYEYEYAKVNWKQNTLNQYLRQYFWDYCKKEPARKYASEIIKKLKEDGNNIYIITSRRYTEENTINGQKSRRIVKKWLKTNEIIFDELYFSKNKIREIDKLKINIMIEDNPKTIPIFVKHTHVFCYDCRYNQKLNLENMTRVYNWYDIYMKIKELEKL